MSLASWLSWTFSRSQARRAKHRNPQSRPNTARLFLEQLEDRALPSAYTAASVSDLIADINAANTAGGANTIQLTAATTAPYVLTAVNNPTTGGISAYGNTGLPVIAANDNLTIAGNGDTIERSTATGTPYFRLLRVVSGGALTLENLTLQGGMVEDFQDFPDGEEADGGAIFNQGTLVLNGVTVQDNAAGFSGVPVSLSMDEFAVYGGGIYSYGGSVTLEGGTIVQNNEVLGTDTYQTLGRGGFAYGGGVYASGGTLTVTNATLDNNTATAGAGGLEAAYGGGLYASGATVAMTNATLDGNAATASYDSYGGGLYLVSYAAAGSHATLTNCTVQGNTAHEGGGLDVMGGPSAVYGDTLINCTVQGNSIQGNDGDGGGLYIAGGFVSLQGDTLESNFANTYGAGGGLYVSAGTVTLSNCTVQGNSALSSYGYGAGGGFYIVAGVVVSLDSFTVVNTLNNTDSTGLNGSTANIDGNVLSPLSPTVVDAASANSGYVPGYVIGTTTNLSALGTDPAGGSSLTYTWAVISAPAYVPTPTFSSNGSNASQNTTATFYQAGTFYFPYTFDNTYTFQVTITDPSHLTVVSSINVTVFQTPSSISVTPGNVTLANGATQPFTATELDQFGQAMVFAQPTFNWHVNGGGTISNTGLYTAHYSGTGAATIQATADGFTGTASVTIQPAPPVITQPASANPNPVTGTTTQLQVQASDPQGSKLSYVWSVTYQPTGAKTPTFNNASANNPTATFSQAGSYTFTVTVKDALGLATTSSVSVTVVQTLTSLSLTPAKVTVANGATQQFTATALDQFGIALAAPPTYTWQVNGGTISSSGLYTAPPSGKGNFQVKVSAGGKNAQASVTVT